MMKSANLDVIDILRTSVLSKDAAAVLLGLVLIILIVSIFDKS